MLCSERVEMIDAHAEVVAQMLLGCCEERAPIFLKALVGDPEALVQGELLAPLTAELLVLALHLTDRTVFGRFGADARSTFMDELLPLVRSKLISPLEEKFPDLYNTRTGFYGSFQKAVPGKNENLKGTLLWEFGKALSAVYANSNPAAVMQSSIDGMDFMITINQLLAKAKVI